MVIAIIALAALLTAQTVYLLYYRRQIKDIVEQLAFISAFDSFKFVETQIKPKEISDLIGICNEILNKQRELVLRFERRNEEINTTIVSLSHDIRTPLTSMDGYLQLAERSPGQADKARYVALAQSRVRQLATLVDELFLYTQLQNPEYRFELETIEVTGVLQRSLLSFHGESARSGREPRLALSGTAVMIIGSSHALERIFGNIIRNFCCTATGRWRCVMKIAESWRSSRSPIR
ncbi:sensor histidine kinase KdpD [Paenibacillus sp. S150]|uniref:sensor histidine kinase n=1 Tax=Paenibacillus sp. S150 TaxID=2749826 RepID=UPI001C55AC1F|nr:histidine kinase dimerization/phospho-acceptor domain-containing protein [Paenibacillus sp. S150]MBW4080153.1 HAMP domain-containing histidine kinase [Paenibacillus sp. S150]